MSLSSTLLRTRTTTEATRTLLRAVSSVRKKLRKEDEKRRKTGRCEGFEKVGGAERGWCGGQAFPNKRNRQNVERDRPSVGRFLYICTFEV
jgi:hypothetical protein